jgi:hypothetical protein
LEDATGAKALAREADVAAIKRDFRVLVIILSGMSRSVWLCVV